MPTTWLIDLGTILGIAVGLGFVIHRFRLPLVVAYLSLGIVVGQFFPWLIAREPLFAILSQIGIVAMLFVIGLQLDVKRLRELGGPLLMLGSLQIVVTTAFGLLLGLAFRLSWTESFFVGYGLSMGSTIVVTKVLGEKHDLGKLYAKISLAMLLLQDVLAAIALVIITAHPSSWQTNAWQPLTVVSVLISVVVLFWLAQRIAMMALPRIAQSQELLLLFGMAWGLGGAAFGSAIGSAPELGALASGLLLASTPFRFEIAAKIRPLRDLFLVIFFLLLGSHVGLRALPSFGTTLVGVMAFILVAKPLIVYVLLIGSSYAKRAAFLAALTQGHVSEFSLLLIALATRNGIVSSEIGSLMTIAGLFSIAVSALLMSRGSDVFDRIVPILRALPFGNRRESIESTDSYDLLLFGCHRVGSDVLRSVMGSDHSLLVVDFDPDRIEQLALRNIPCRYGDAEDPDFLNELPWKRARMMISSIPDPSANYVLLETARKRQPKCLTLIVAHHAQDALAYYDAGASYVIVPHDLGGMHASTLLERHGFRTTGFAKERSAHRQALRNRLERDLHGSPLLPQEETGAYT